MSSKKRNQREIQFLEKTLYPILEAMSPNITDLKYRHGNMEFGKDFTFSYTNPLNQRINVGIQAKWGDVTGKAAEVKDITSQVDLAFTVPYITNLTTHTSLSMSSTLCVLANSRTMPLRLSQEHSDGSTMFFSFKTQISSNSKCTRI